MQVDQIELLISAVSPEQYPSPDVPEIALAGRSNVGKSSFINKLVDRLGVARTSSKPGKTQTLNFYNVDDRFRLVDVPGYGYAKVSKSDRLKWGRMIQTYLESRPNLVALFLLMDFRHEPTALDMEMKDYADNLEIPYAIIATKIDKIKASHYNKHISQFVKKLDLPSDEGLFLFSSLTGQGKEDIWDMIEALVDSDA